MTDEMDARRVRVRVEPEPTDEEMAAIAAVVTALAASSASAAALPGEVNEAGGEGSRWLRAARREGLRSSVWPPEDA